MHYYKRNLGDYAKKAGRLSMLQHGSYTLLIDACYDREQFPTMDEAIDWTWCSSTAEIEAVKFVLSKFFVLEDGRYVQKRIQQEILEYHAKSETNARIAAERETKRKSSTTNRARTVHEPARDDNESPPNHKPITINQEPITKNQKEREGAQAAPPPTPPEKKSAPQTLATYLDDCKAAKAKPIPDGHSLRNWAQEAGITAEMLQIAWVLFRERYTEAEKGKGKRYRDWPAHFATAVKGNWLKVWFVGDAGMQWSSIGMTHKTVLDARMARQEAEHA